MMQLPCRIIGKLCRGRGVEMEILIQAMWAIAPGIIVGVVMAVWNKQQKHRTDMDEQREKERIESERLRISLLVATAQLSYAVAMAKKRGSVNGEMEAAIKQYEIAMENFRLFERKQIAKNLFAE